MGAEYAATLEQVVGTFKLDASAAAANGIAVVPRPGEPGSETERRGNARTGVHDQEKARREGGDT